MTLSSLIGNDSVKAFLEAVASHKTGPQVFLFAGPEGVGKKAFALAFAEMLLGEKHAKKVQKLNHPDLFCFQPEGKTHTHPIASIRKILEEAALPPFESPLKITIIEEVERMLPASSNALLKTLEEPTIYSRFILLTSRVEEVLPTIASRCCKVSFHPIEESSLAQYLISQKNIEPQKASQIALASQGSFSKAIQLAEALEDPIRLCFLSVLKNCFLLPPSFVLIDSLGKLEKLLEKKNGSDEESTSLLMTMDLLFEDLLFWLRDLHLLKETSSSEKLFHVDFFEDLEKQLQTQKIPSLEQVLLFVEEARFALQRSTKPKAVLEHLFTRIAQQNL